MTSAHDFVSQITYLATRRVGGGPKLPWKRLLFRDSESRKSYLERETGLEPATLCLGIGWVAFLAAQTHSGKFCLETGRFGHLTQDVLSI